MMIFCKVMLLTLFTLGGHADHHDHGPHGINGGHADHRSDGALGLLSRQSGCLEEEMCQKSLKEVTMSSFLVNW